MKAQIYHHNKFFLPFLWMVLKWLASAILKHVTYSHLDIANLDCLRIGRLDIWFRLFESFYICSMEFYKSGWRFICCDNAFINWLLSFFTGGMTLQKAWRNCSVKRLFLWVKVVHSILNLCIWVPQWVAKTVVSLRYNVFHIVEWFLFIGYVA